MQLINAPLRGLFDLLLLPFRGLPVILALVVVSLVTSIGMLVVFKRTSNQAAIERVKRGIHAGLFEIRLFNDDFAAMLRAQGSILRYNLHYLRLSLVPMLFLLPPVLLIIAQLQFHWGYAPLPPGQSSILAVTLAEGWEAGGTIPTLPSGKPRARLKAPAGVVVETPAVWVPSRRTLSWRLRLDRPGDYDLEIVLGEQRISKRLNAATGPGRRSPRRPGSSFLDQLLYPAEARLPGSSPVAVIDIGLPDADVDVFGWTVGETLGMPAWMFLFFVLSVVFAFALRKPFGVEI